MTDRFTILVLGSYGLAGREVTRGLIEKTDASVIASGRNIERLRAFFSGFGSERLTLKILDGSDRQALSAACRPADLVINCIGPYSLGGAGIARTVIESGTNYIDCANEQSHIRDMEKLDSLAKKQGLCVITGAGQTTGVSTLAMLHAAAQVPDVSELKMFCVIGNSPDAEGGLASFLGAIIESGLGAVAYDDGQFVHEQIGDFSEQVEMPKPFGKVTMYDVPIGDAILVPKRVSGLKTLRTYFDIGVKPPPGLVSMIRATAPHRRKWAYWLLKTVLRLTKRMEFAKGQKLGLTPSGFLKFTAKNGKNRWGALISFDDGGEMTSFLPILFAERMMKGGIKERGVLTPADLLDWGEFLSGMESLGWDIDVREEL